MRLFLMMLLLAAFNIASSKALSSPAEKEKSSLHITAPVIDVVAFTADKKRFLRTQNKHVADVGHPDEEERAFTWATKLGSLLRTKDTVKLEKFAKKQKYRQWLKDGEDPATIYAKLGLTGQGPAANLKNDPRFHEYIEFSALWRHKKGTLAKEWWQFWRKNAW
ncbi:hypothetical protein F441_18608 [Phytophthora nicotianae CJ01A1]|uniref:RxLR effector protein n=4 Tax=Phytophthora nicotianae TaxID=4792 RepID=V9E700_PHYNI|nr:hypothetical protein F443_18748 [Phytophthora nicotianae P1569]ETK75117.1 hypothetical protein L915_18231 [Phytophthora nicotianae]ETL81797.1 hypothetical protein L917_17952 [Phytophthora nicotianae]ETM35000.1 hypothetical protein L914_18037 [Phytophthora nicotianae]ETP04691.1 hypothetical protein F441_18608 [Phytophthora nicotianae CJ01A1]